METSAKDATNVHVAFERVLNEIYKIANKSQIDIAKNKTDHISRGSKLSEEEERPDSKKGQKLTVAAAGKKKGKGGCC